MADNYVVENMLLDLKHKIHEMLQKIGTESSFHGIVLRKKSRDLKSGDIILPRGCIKASEEKISQFLSLAESQLLCGSHIARLAQDKFSVLAVFLNRASVLQTVLNEVQECGSQYGLRKSKDCLGCIALNIISEEKAGVSMSETSSLTDMRCSSLHSHVRNLLEAHRYSVICLNDLSKLSCHPDSATHAQSIRDAILTRALKYPKTVETSEISDTKQEEKGSSESGENSRTTDCVIDLQCVIKDRGYAVGKDGFDKNLCKATVLLDGVPSSVTESAIKLEECVLHMLADQELTGCINIVPQSQAFRQQQVHLVWQALSDRCVPQSHLTVGPVIQKSDSAVQSDPCENTAKLFQKLRLEQMTEAAEMRYGEAVEDEARKNQITQLTQASITFDILQNASHVQLHLSACSPGEGLESRTGAFIMYNTARLATLFEHFSQGVKKGIYPPLPSLKETDFTLLREEEEWELLFLFISRFPETVHQSVECVIPSDGKIAAKVHTHKISNFLVGFSKRLSSYYSRYHILGGGELHLLPLMFARLHLMRAAHQVLLNALRLIGLEALDHL